MKSLAVRLGLLTGWTLLGTLLAAAYGIVNDQITVTLSPEYFSVFKRAQFWDALEQFGFADAPTRVQAVLVGALATWWFGLILGLLLGTIGITGRRPPLTMRAFFRAVAGVIACTFTISVLSGVAAYAVEPAIRPDVDHWPFLDGIQHVRPAFAVGFWHDGAYLGGLLGTIAACPWVWRHRREQSED